LQQKHQGAEEQRIVQERARQDAESRLAQLIEKHGAELSERELAYRELELSFHAAEQQWIDLETALKGKEWDIEQLVERHATELAKRDAAYREVKQKYEAAETQTLALQSALQHADSRLAKITESHNSELSRRELANRDLEQKLQNAENQIQNLRNEQSALEQMVKTHEAELSRRDLSLKELESKYQAAEQQKVALQRALYGSESRLAQLVERQSAEASQRDFAQKKAEQKYQAAEKQRTLLEETLRSAQSDIARLNETHGAERAQWDLARQELEEKCQIAEQQKAIAMQNAVRETESRIAWISEQNQAKAMQLEAMQQEMEQMKAAYRQLVEASSDFHLRNQRLSRFTSVGVVLAKQNGEVLECNDAAASMFGYAGAEEALSLAGQNQFRIYAFQGSLAARLQQDGKLENIEWSILDHNRRLIRVQENAFLVETSTGEPPLVERILTDISKIHKLKEEVRRARRLESTGELAAATVNSLKDLCAALVHSSEVLVRSSNDSAAVQRVAEALLSDANRGVKHARQFLSIASKADRPSSLLNLNEILTSNQELLHRLIDEDIDLQTNLAPGLGLVSADCNEMTQLIGNLLTSARDALPLGGTVAIETSNFDVDSLALNHPIGLTSGIYVRMLFSADGCAVRPERRLGSNQILAERIGGYLETTNDPKLGNICAVYLPRVETCSGQAGLLSDTVGA
jgi:PAS domain S-box-containing protein